MLGNLSTTYVRTITTALAMVLSLVCMASSRAGVPSSAEMKMAVYPRAIWSVPIYAAKEQGYFAKYGIKPVFIPVNTGPAAIAALVSKSVDTASVSPEVILGAIASGLDAQVFASTIKAPWIIVAAKTVPLKNSPYPDSLHALKGLTVGVPARPSAGEGYLKASLLGAGMKSDDVKIVAVGLGPTAIAALGTGQVQALVTSNPISDQALTQFGAKIVADPRKGEVPKGLDGPYNGQWVMKTYAQAHPDRIKAFRAALRDASHWLADPANNASVAKFMSEYYGIKGLDYDAMARESESLWTVDYTQQALDTFVAYDVKYGFLKESISTKGVLWK